MGVFRVPSVVTCFIFGMFRGHDTVVIILCFGPHSFLSGKLTFHVFTGFLLLLDAVFLAVEVGQPDADLVENDHG